ncbi:MAG: fibronectin type III domain-containing protein, partial [bacterium]|nr:fibronectin type III domain-containing protein [bacterium]
MKMWKIFLLGAVALALTTTGFAQPAAYFFAYYDDGSGHNPPLGCPCTDGSIYPDGVDICLYWDQNGDGFSADDPQPGTGEGYGQVFQNCYEMNGVAGEIGQGFFTTDNLVYFAMPVDPESGDNPYYYWKISAGVGADECCWYTDTFRVNAGDLTEVFLDIEDWTCLPGLCPSDITPPNPPTNCNASDDTQCLAVQVTWQHDGENVTSFKVYRDDDATPVATANAVARTAVFPETSTTPHTYYVRAFNTSLPSDPSNTDVGSTYLKRFVSGPD